MKKFSYSDICNALGPIYGELVCDPYIKAWLTKYLVFQAESGLRKLLQAKVKNGNLEIKCSDKIFCMILSLVSKWLAENWIPAEDIYFEILEYTDCSPSITHKDFIDKLKRMKAGVASCVVSNENSQKESYFMEKKYVKGFIAMEYGDSYRKARSSVENAGYYGFAVHGEIPGGNIAFYRQNQESAVLPYALSQPLVFQNFMEVKHPVVRDMDKKETLDALIKTLIKRHQDLEEQQTVLGPNEKREAKIKSIIMDLVFVLKTQAEYIRKYFKQDIDVLVNRYNSGDWMSISEIKSFFYPEPLPQQIMVASGTHIR
jgi:hypothetical protein